MERIELAPCWASNAILELIEKIKSKFDSRIEAMARQSFSLPTDFGKTLRFTGLAS